jgi:predicted transposase YdaD
MAKYKELQTPIDRVSKLLFKEYADLLLALLFPGQTVHLLDIEENIEINLPTRPVDMVMTISTGTGEEERKQALHVEYYVAHEAHIPQTLFIYSAELTDRMKMAVATVVIYSERREKALRPKPEYVVNVGERVTNRFEYLDIWLVDYKELIESGELAPLAPFLVELVTEPTEATVRLARELANKEPDEERRALLLSFVVLLAARYFDRETIRRLFREEEKMIRTQTFIDEWLDEAEQKGHQEGRQEGRQEAILETLLQFLAYKFGAVSDGILQQLQALPAAGLSTLFNLALTAQNLQEVEKAITAMPKTLTAE